MANLTIRNVDDDVVAVLQIASQKQQPLPGSGNPADVDRSRAR